MAAKPLLKGIVDATGCEEDDAARAGAGDRWKRWGKRPGLTRSAAISRYMAVAADQAARTGHCPPRMPTRSAAFDAGTTAMFLNRGGASVAPFEWVTRPMSSGSTDHCQESNKPYRKGCRLRHRSHWCKQVAPKPSTDKNIRTSTVISLDDR